MYLSPPARLPRLHRLPRVGSLLLLAAALVAPAPPAALARGRDKEAAPTPRFVPTYAAAWAQARARNAVLWAVFHKDD